MGPAWTWIYLRHLFEVSVRRPPATSSTAPLTLRDGAQDSQGALTRALNEIVDMLRVHNTEHRLLCLLQMLWEMMRCHPSVPAEPLRRLIVALDPFYCWPCPFGPLAQQMIALAERELAAPGAALREAYLLERPAVAEASAAQLADRHGASVPVLFDEDATNAHFLNLALTTAPSASPPGGHSAESGLDSVAKLLLHILYRAGAQVVDLPPDAAAIIQQRAASDPDAVVAA